MYCCKRWMRSGFLPLMESPNAVRVLLSFGTVRALGSSAARASVKASRCVSAEDGVEEVIESSLPSIHWRQFLESLELLGDGWWFPGAD